MTWKYDALNHLALNLESQATFKIQRSSRRLDSPADFELVPPDGSSNAWLPEELEQLKADLWLEMQRVWKQADLRLQLSSLIRNKLGGDNYRAASVISGISGKTISARSIQAWLAEPTKRSSRTCPEWAVAALETYAPPPQTVARPAEAPLTAWEVKNRFGVDYAEREIDSEEKLQKEWAATNLTVLPAALASLEWELRRHLDYLNESINLWRVALKTGKSFEEFQQLALEKLDDAASRRHYIQEDKLAIKQGRDEFSNPEGLPTGKGGAQ